MSNKIYKIILAVSLIVMIVAGINIFRLSREYQKGINEYKELEQYITVIADSSEEETQAPLADESVIPVSLDIDFESLKSINEDVIGWLYYEPLELSYPIVRGNDNEYYTLYTFEQEKNSSGAIFMDFLNRTDFSDYNTIIYGHNMRNGTMFGSLKQLLNDSSIISENPYFYIFTQDQAYMYEIASVYITDSSSHTYDLITSTDDQKAFIDYILSVSSYLWDKEINVEDKIVTLSTCHGLHTNNRTVVHGILIAQEDR